MKRLIEFFQDGDGHLSATRLAFLLVIFSAVGVWIMQCVHEKKMVPYEQSVVYLVGVLMVGKVAQSVTENAPPKQ